MIPLRDDNPTSTTPYVTILLIITNALIFLGQATLGRVEEQAFVFQFGAVPALVTGQAALPPEISPAIPAAGTLVTCMFLHGGLMHILGNMLYLWIFGNNIEDAMGHVKFLFFYLLTGLVASFTHIGMHPLSEVPIVGASGAISGVLGAYILLYPKARVLVLIPMGIFTRTVFLPAGTALGLWFAFQILNGAISRGAGGGVAWFAHIGGFLAGLLLVGLFKRRGIPFFKGRNRRRSMDFRV